MTNEEIKQMYIKRFWSKVDITEDQNACWNWKFGKDKDGYGVYYAYNELSTRSHRYSFAISNNYSNIFGNPNIPQGLIVMHICDNPSCCNPKHLKLGTTQENVDDKFAKKRAKGFDKTLLPKVLEMRSQGLSWKQIGKNLGYGTMTIYNAVNGRPIEGTSRSWSIPIRN